MAAINNKKINSLNTSFHKVLNRDWLSETEQNYALKKSNEFNFSYNSRAAHDHKKSLRQRLIIIIIIKLFTVGKYIVTN